MKIVLSAVLAFLIVGCSSEAPKEEKVPDTKQIEIVKEKSALEQATQTVEEVKADATVKAAEVKESVVAKVEDVKADLETKVTETKASVVETTTEVVDTVKSKVAEVETQVADTVTNAVAQVQSQTIDAALLYKKCAGCHGSNGERAALGKSAIIKDWSSIQVEEALLGYKDGTYGAAMKAIMKPQVSGLSAAEIKALSKYISDM